MHTYLLSIYLLYLNCFGAFLIFSLSLPFFLFTLVMSMAPKRKSILSQNRLHSGASSSFNPTPSHLRFCDENARKDFSENFSRRDVRSECRVILEDFVDTDLPTMWCPGHLSDCADLGVLLQHAWFWFFNTFLFYSHSRYAYWSHTVACCGCALCSKGRASWLLQLWASEDCVQRRDDFCFLWASRKLGWSLVYTM